MKIITEKIESAETTIVEKNEIYCKAYDDYEAKILFKNGVYYEGKIV